MKALLSVVLVSLAALPSAAQDFDLIIRNGHVIDPKNGIDRVTDVGIAGDSIAAVAREIDPARAENVVDATGLYVTPGLIDMHVHVFHGTGSFMYSAGVPATRAGLWPDVISIDLHTGSMNGGMKDLTNVMSKFLALGMSLNDVVRAATWTPAQVIRRTELGHLDVGAEADVAVFRLREDGFGFVDTRGFRQTGDRKLEAELTLRAGRIVWDLNGISSRDQVE